MTTDQHDVTQLLEDVRAGKAAASDELFPLIYDELRRLAAARLHHERVNHTLQPTALVHEAYLRLVDQTRITWRSRAHFFGAAANAIRRILVDSARAKKAVKRGGGKAPLVDVDPAATELDLDQILDLDEALETLAAADARAARIVELRYFGGLSIEQTAELVGVSHATVERDWSAARAWLASRLGDRKDEA